MSVRVLSSPFRQAWGAMFSKGLGDRVLLFAYPHPAARLFHTFCCPKLRILALDDGGEVIFDRVVPSGRFVQIPRTRLVVECDPGHPLPEKIADLFAGLDFFRQAAGLQAEFSVRKLIAMMFAYPVADMHRLSCATQGAEEINPAVVRRKFSPWERGRLLDSAGFLVQHLDYMSIPPKVGKLALGYLRAEEPYFPDLIAAYEAGSDAWREEFERRCLRCHRDANWRGILSPPDGLPPEHAWRYNRPENHVPLCRHCVYELGWNHAEEVRIRAGVGLWGPRFEAFQRLHTSYRKRLIPAGWEVESFPLWPESFGGDYWETGSGHVDDAEPREPSGVHRSARHREALAPFLPASKRKYTRQAGSG